MTVISIRVTTCRPFSARTATGRLGRALSIALSAGVLWRSSFYSFFRSWLCELASAHRHLLFVSPACSLACGASPPPSVIFSPAVSDARVLTLACVLAFILALAPALVPALALALALALAPMHAPPHTTTIQEKIYKRQINKQSRAARAVDSWQVVRHDSFIRVT